MVGFEYTVEYSTWKGTLISIVQIEKNGGVMKKLPPQGNIAKCNLSPSSGDFILLDIARA